MKTVRKIGNLTEKLLSIPPHFFFCNARTSVHTIWNDYRADGQGCQENFWAPEQKEAWPPPPILQIMILKLSPPRCVISNKNELMNCDLENGFLLVYLSEFMFFFKSLIITSYISIFAIASS